MGGTRTIHRYEVFCEQMILGNVNRPLKRDYISVLERNHIYRELIALLSRSIASDRPARYQQAGELAQAIKSLPKKLIAEPVVVSVVDREKQLFEELDRRVADVRPRNEKACQLFEVRRWKKAKAPWIASSIRCFGMANSTNVSACMPRVNGSRTASAWSSSGCH